MRQGGFLADLVSFLFQIYDSRR